MISRADCVELDRADPLASFRDRFALPDGVIYLCGNSLGALPKATPARLRRVIEEEWGTDLVASWNSHDWVTLAQSVGAKLARFLGAGEDEVIVADSTSVNLFKLLAGALRLADSPARRVIVAERTNFPTDLYIIQGLNALLGGHYELRLVDGNDIAAHIADNVAAVVLTEVDYRSGRLLDMRGLNAAARSAGTRIVWDLSHSAGAIPVNLAQAGAELAIGCGYKYLNGGPGAPAFLFVARQLHAGFRQPLTGWFGHAAPFDFDPDYRPAPGVDRMMTGTPPVLGIAALECGVDIFLDADMTVVRAKSLALGDLFIALAAQELSSRDMAGDLALMTPREPDRRGSQLAFLHAHAYPIMQALIERGVHGDFRRPNILRFGLAPLYLRHTDIWDAVAVLADVIKNGTWKDARFSNVKTVT